MGRVYSLGKLGIGTRIWNGTTEKLLEETSRGSDHLSFTKGALNSLSAVAATWRFVRSQLDIKTTSYSTDLECVQHSICRGGNSKY